jgi:hypothetical protein
MVRTRQRIKVFVVFRRSFGAAAEECVEIGYRISRRSGMGMHAVIIKL